MEKVYGKLAQKNLAQMQLGVMKQTEDMTVSEFYSAISIIKKAQEAYAGEDMEHSTVQSALTTIFLHGILDKPSALNVINNRQPKTLHDAYVFVTVI